MVAPEIASALIAGVVALLGTPFVNFGLQELKPKLEGGHISLDDMQKLLNSGLGGLLALQRNKNWEVLLEDKAAAEDYRTWTDRVKVVEKEVISLNKKYENRAKSTYRSDNDLKRDVKSALTKVLELIEKCPEKILADYKPPERVIKENGVPSVAEYPTQSKPFNDILDLLLLPGNKRVKCVALHGQRGVGKTTIMQNLNNHFYHEDHVHFDMVIFIRVAADYQTDKRTEGVHILQEIAQRIKVDEQGDESQVARRIEKVLEHKIYLLILDGVRYQRALEGIWESLDISKHKTDSKVVITTHYPLPLKTKCVNRAVELKPLSTNEEWEMFQSIGNLSPDEREAHIGSLSLDELEAGIVNLSPEKREARILCKRFCFCLPILICPLASSFKNEEPPNWGTALSEYTSWAEVEDLDKIYSNLKICYKRLQSQSSKKCFLYASLYPANTKIYTRYFVECCIVQGIHGDVDATSECTEMLGKAIRKTLKHLVNVALLEEGESYSHTEQMRYFRMNGLYRGFALHLSRDSNSGCKIYVDNEKHQEASRSESWRKARWVSMVGSKRDCLPSGKNFGNLETLLLQENLNLVQIPQDCVDSMGNLLVLNLYGTKVKELPNLSRLTRLKALYLNGCSDLQIDPFQIKQLEHLQVFDIRGTRVNFVPCLISLRYLRISYIPKGDYDGILELRNLEELTIDVEEKFIQEWSQDSGHIIQIVKSFENRLIFKLKLL